MSVTTRDSKIKYKSKGRNSKYIYFISVNTEELQGMSEKNKRKRTKEMETIQNRKEGRKTGCTSPWAYGT